MGQRSRRSLKFRLVILALLVVGLGSAGRAEAREVDAAMGAFSQAMYRKNPQGVLAAFSRTSPWRYVNYEIGSGKQLSSRMVTFSHLEADFQRKTGWYNFFFAKPNGYTFMVLFLRGEPWQKRGASTFVPPGADSRTHITWRQEGGRWVIGEIGETTP
jgi:hypothetical protein